MKKIKILAISSLCFFLVSTLNAQQLQTGSIKGTVADPEGIPLPGVTVTATSPSLIGSVSDVTDANGSYRCPALPAGTYTVLAELEAFSTVKRENVVLRIAMVVRIDIEMSPSPIGEEITVTAPSPTVDVESTKMATTVTKNLIENLPIGRDILKIGLLVPGVLWAPRGNLSHGGTEISNALEVDGVSKIDAWMNRPYTLLQYDSMEEVEVVTGGLPAQVGNTSGSYINVVTKSGGNDFSGMTQVYYTNEDLSQVLFSNERIKTMNVGRPEAPIYDLDASAMIGGPVIKDKLWFYGNFSLFRWKYSSDFAPVEIEGILHPAYDNITRQWQGFLKLTTQISKSMRFFAMFNVSNRKWPLRLGRTQTFESTTYMDPKWEYTLTGNLSWLLGSNTFIDLRGGYVAWTENQVPREGTHNNITKTDGFSGYMWGAAHRGAETDYSYTIHSSARLTHFQDNFLGADHELRAGIDIQIGGTRWAVFKGNPMVWHYYNGNPYYYRGLYGLDGPHPTYGDGWVDFGNCGPENHDSETKHGTERYSFFIQDSLTIKERLTLNIGLRFDTYNGYIPAGVKKASAGIAEAVGEYYLTPVYGFNPYGQMEVEEWKDIMGWSPISPRIGISYDLFGDGKTALKAAFSQYAEAMPSMYFENAHPFRYQLYSWYWWDLNNNAIADAPPTDTYQLRSGDPRELEASFYKNRIAKDIKAPMYDEFTVSINHELAQNFRVSLQYINKNKRNTADSALYDPDTGRWWNTYELAPEYWIPFTTIVPGYGPFADQEVTMYFMSNDSPKMFTAFGNRPEAKRKFQALEITFEKRMSNGWQLGGSVEFSRTRGNNSGSYGSVWGAGGAYDNANWFVNRYGPVQYDIPFIVKLYGTFELPLGFIASFNFIHQHGSPFGRTVTVYPPSDWAATNNCQPLPFSVNVEVPDRRYQAFDNLDLRLEKKFILGKYGEIGAFLDVFNLLGSSYVDLGEDPGGTWRPAAENTNVGTYTPGYWYGKITGIRGTRVFKFSIRFTF